MFIFLIMDDRQPEHAVIKVFRLVEIMNIQASFFYFNDVHAHSIFFEARYWFQMSSTISLADWIFPMAADTCPISNSPSSRSPSNIPLLARRLPSSCCNASGDAP